ncbi:hypothetical protein KQI63_04790 [bacterium]|nr:hypothetical protein [bacterium]
MSSSGREALSIAARDDLMRGLGLLDSRLGRLLHPLVTPLVGEFADSVLRFDREVGQLGWGQAADGFLKGWEVQLSLAGKQLPSEGPLLVLSNHPGLTDSLALMSTLARDDLTFYAHSNPFLEALPEVRRRLLLLDREQAILPSHLRRGIHHLKAGGALALYPAGKIEPDPAIHPDALSSLDHWSSSMAFFARQVPQARLAIVLIRGCISPLAQYHWLTRLRRTRAAREELAAMLQVVIKRFRAQRVEVDVSSTIRIGELVSEVGEEAVYRVVMERTKRLMRERDVEAGWL